METRAHIRNRHLSMEFGFSRGLSLESIHDELTGHCYLPQATSLFEFAVDAQADLRDSRELLVDSAEGSADRGRLVIQAHAPPVPLRFVLTLETEPESALIHLSLRLENTGDAPLSVRMVVPRVRGLTAPGRAEEALGAVPQEIGSVAPLRDTPAIGGWPNPDIGLPTEMNTLELVSLYDPSGGGGIFVAASPEGAHGLTAPIQMQITRSELAGYWVGAAAPRETVSLPRLSVGVHHSGDWHAACDAYRQEHGLPNRLADSPAWLREAAGLYASGGEGGGACYQIYPTIDLKERLGTFDNLPRLLTEARTLGADVVYLYDYWEGAGDGKRPPYWNKGDYIPRADMGGARALIEGVRRIHDAGGRVLYYLEPFIVYGRSRIGQEKGQAWGGRDPAGELYRQYPDNYTMVAPHAPWQEFVVEVACRLVREYGADGIFLDSWGWQWNWPMQTEEEGVLYASDRFNAGVLQLTDRVRAAIRRIKPDAVVLGESLQGPLAWHLDAGLSADFAWRRPVIAGRIVGSPLRYLLPEAQIFSSGETLNDLHQVFAAGHSLALCHHWLDRAADVKRLVEIRKRHKDAMIYGHQEYQPATGDSAVPAFFYRGQQSQIITVVNTAKAAYSGHVRVRETEADSLWQELLTGETVRTQDRVNLPLTIPSHALRVLLRSSPDTHAIS